MMNKVILSYWRKEVPWDSKCEKKGRVGYSGHLGLKLLCNRNNVGVLNPTRSQNNRSKPGKQVR